MQYRFTTHFVTSFALLLAIVSPHLFSSTVPILPSAQSFNTSKAGSSGPHEFTSDELVIYGSDGDGKPFLLELSLNRKEQTESEFVHYYTASLIHGSSQDAASDTFTSSEREVQTNSMFQTFKRIRAEDLSTEEHYRFEARLGARMIRVWLPRLQADFLVRNVPEYTKYASAGEATVEVDGKRFTAQAFVSTIYSSDYSRYLFFPGHRTLRSETHYLVLWDEDGNLFVVDSSNVSAGSSAYRSHTWVLQKDARTKSTQKAFEALVKLELTDAGLPMRWSIAIPAIKHTSMQLSVALPRHNDPHEGIVHGTVNVEGRQKVVSGLFYHHVYGSKGTVDA